MWNWLRWTLTTTAGRVCGVVRSIPCSARHAGEYQNSQAGLPLVSVFSCNHNRCKVALVTGRLPPDTSGVPVKLLSLQTAVSKWDQIAYNITTANTTATTVTRIKDGTYKRDSTHRFSQLLPHHPSRRTCHSATLHQRGGCRARSVYPALGAKLWHSTRCEDISPEREVSIAVHATEAARRRVQESPLGEPDVRVQLKGRSCQ